MKEFINRETNAGKIKKVFILPNGEKQFLINGEYYNEKAVGAKNLFLVREYARKIKPNLFELWAMSRVYSDFKNQRISFKEEFEFNNKFMRKKHRNLQGLPYNFANLIQDVEFKLKEFKILN
ncbi:hypothetical protein RIZ47_001679 [Campylobacter coli]|uniref:hypothetical protein n=1 Tax=Campylobacter coli TaxID=195 RepID=UPI000930D3EE|nr:hypothetical protein [Campylobacter coli]EAJ8838702.1 hypothetical protein [Campylobacter coli]EAK7322603.1 hypothetical protein [Campylobacter coli]EFN3027757.1 hypothetical protein [Campylobacter coli]EFV3742398.1 hypothetical protein [Campylobacter coli]EGS8471583.1 hypothetical protein [Campylobacter coli]